MLLQNVLQMYRESGPVLPRWGVSWKNMANPVVINRLPQFAIACKIRMVGHGHQQNFAHVAAADMLVSFSVTDSLNAEIFQSNTARNFCS